MVKTAKATIAKVHPHKEEKEIFPCKKSGRKNPVAKPAYAGKGTFKSKKFTKPVIKINKRLLRQISSSHALRSDI